MSCSRITREFSFLSFFRFFLFPYSFHFISVMGVFHSHTRRLGGRTIASGVEQYVSVSISGTREARGEISAMQTKGMEEKSPTS